MDKTRIKTRNRPRFDRLNLDRPLLPSLRCVRLCEARLLCVLRCSFCRFCRRFEDLYALRCSVHRCTQMIVGCVAYFGTWREELARLRRSRILRSTLFASKLSTKHPQYYNLADKPSVYGDLGAQKITLSWKIMATHFKIDAIHHFNMICNFSMIALKTHEIQGKCRK